MDLRDTPEEAAFRAELRAWLETNLSDEIRRGRFEEATQAVIGQEIEYRQPIAGIAPHHFCQRQ